MASGNRKYEKDAQRGTKGRVSSCRGESAFAPLFRMGMGRKRDGFVTLQIRPFFAGYMGEPGGDFSVLPFAYKNILNIFVYFPGAEPPRY